MYTSFFKVNSHTFVGPPVAHLSFLVLYFFRRLTFELLAENLWQQGSGRSLVSNRSGKNATENNDKVVYYPVGNMPKSCKYHF